MPELETLVTLYAKVYLRFMRLADRRMTEEGASLARTKLLLFLERNGPRRSTDIAEYFGQSPRTVTEAIDALERERLVRRDPDPEDRRAKLVSVTGEGRAAAAKTEPLRHELIEQIFGGLSDDERRMLSSVLANVSARLDEQPDCHAPEPRHDT